MKKIIILFISAFLCLSTSYARKLTGVEIQYIASIIDELVSTTHEELQGRKVQIKIRSIKSSEYYFNSNFGIGRFLFGVKKYKIGVNPTIFDRDIPEDALIGVLAHELIHTEDYHRGSTVGTIIPIGIKVMKKKSRRKYERQTDLKLVRKGLGMNMKSYRQWQYPFLKKNDLATKKKEYLTPEEFDFLEEVRTLYPELLNKWIENPPKNIEGFKKEYLKFISY